MSHIDNQIVAEKIMPIAWISESLMRDKTAELNIDDLTREEYLRLCDEVASEMNDDHWFWNRWWDVFHTTLATTALKVRHGVKCSDPAAIFCSCCGGLHEDVYFVDVRDDDNEPISHGFIADNDEHAIEVATDIVEHFYHRELANGNWIDVMKPERDENDKAFYGECDFDCIYTFSEGDA